MFMIYANCQHTLVSRIEEVLQENIELQIEVRVSFLELFIGWNASSFAIKNNWSLILDTRVLAHELFLKNHTTLSLKCKANCKLKKCVNTFLVHDGSTCNFKVLQKFRSVEKKEPEVSFQLRDHKSSAGAARSAFAKL